MTELTWIEISKAALKNNICELRKVVGREILLCPCIKSNAYGHGLVETAEVFAEAGADWVSVNSIKEAKKLRENGFKKSIYVLGYVALADLEEAIELEVRLVVYNKETIEALGRLKKTVKVHIKVETGNNRQGVLIKDLIDFAAYIKQFSNIETEGLTTHFANIEDTTDHSYAEKQIAKFEEAVEILQKLGVEIKIKHCANSAASILFKKTHFDMVRTGIASYGMWPSTETFVAYKQLSGVELNLMPAFTWKTKIAQVKEIAEGEFIGYGCTYKTSRPTRLAILPIGYYDGYDRGTSGAHVLIHGKRAPVRGRICMNIIMVDVTDIPEAGLEDEVVLIGRDGEEMISAEQFAKWSGTINYEVTTRVNETIKRVFA